ncbi:MAG: ribosome biosis GTPase / thiamine phosphate phosphatase [Solirubrobacteraceae bacterium]|nr:ribosome biosis GTPase / thiamine phosphate phosphatase [Solirubrobacteraceae bacterium]
MDLQDLGWNACFADAFASHEANGLIPARVAARHHGPCELLTARGRLGGVPAGKLSDDELPVVGDWVAARTLDGERKVVIEAVLPRRTAFTRKEAWRRTVEQVVAANVDTMLLTTAFGADLNPRRIERYLTATWDSGADPVLVVNKLDEAIDAPGEIALVEAVALGVPVLAISATTGEGVEALDRYFLRGRTVAVVGSSGVGKTTLVNRLLGGASLPTAATSAGGQGRHATTRRDLFLLPTGGVLLDTPGMRELQMWADEEALDSTFPEVAALAGACRFGDCSHDREPGCAVQSALSDGSLAVERYDSWRKQQREIRALERRRNGRLRVEAKRQSKQMARSLRRYHGH